MCNTIRNAPFICSTLLLSLKPFFSLSLSPLFFSSAELWSAAGGWTFTKAEAKTYLREPYLKSTWSQVEFLLWLHDSPPAIRGIRCRRWRREFLCFSPRWRGSLLGFSFFPFNRGSLTEIIHDNWACLSWLLILDGGSESQKTLYCSTAALWDAGGDGVWGKCLWHKMLKHKVFEGFGTHWRTHLVGC